MHALCVKEDKAVAHFVRNVGLSMRVVPRIMKHIRPGIQQCVPGRFARISRVRRLMEHEPSLHERMFRKAYDEAQDIRGMSALRGPEWNGDRE